jgi:hypothetical protein
MVSTQGQLLFITVMQYNSAVISTTVETFAVLSGAIAKYYMWHIDYA